MGGRDGGRGYLYQSIAALLGSLKDDEWKYVEVEVESANDKVDIKWEYNDGKIKVVQVKSSQNNIPKSGMIEWLKKLTEDAPEADEFELFLIGNVQDTTSKFISKLNKAKTWKKTAADYKDLKDLIKFLPKIKIVLENFHQKSLESKSKWGLFELLSTMGHVVPPAFVNLMINSMLGQFALFSTDGKKLKREEYIKQLKASVYLQYPKVKDYGLTKKELSVEFYLKDQIEFSNTMTAIKGNSLNLISSRKESLIELIREIESMVLPPYKEEQKKTEEKIDLTGISSMSSTRLRSLVDGDSTEAQYKSAEASDELKEEIIYETKKLLGVDIEKAFFHVGQLKKVDSVLDSDEIGSTSEKDKDYLISRLALELMEYKGIAEYMNYIDSFNIVPLVLRNTGSISDENIEVNIKFPKYVDIMSGSNLKDPNRYAVKAFNDNEDLINNIFKHKKSYNLEEFVGESQPVAFFERPVITGVHASHIVQERERDGMLKRKALHDLKQLFDFKFYEESEYNVLQFHFKRLNSSKNMAFPTLLLIQASESFTIEYEITSKKLGEKVEGILYYQI
ncbi:hypothetical protein [Priestia megaterium]|uniref:hypothetical protein n=1 Tax=Priestia megaterium TaxID=1404 RepID=UPI001C52D4E5|nr:hypothetical protein [Priestia megaterium]MBW0933948.1 hypothetical protein [Priestia megaterium]